MVVVPKANGQVRICVDLTKLNERECHILLSVEQVLAQIGDAKHGIRHYVPHVFVVILHARHLPHSSFEISRN